jgi:hypothetical protein
VLSVIIVFQISILKKHNCWSASPHISDAGTLSELAGNFLALSALAAKLSQAKRPPYVLVPATSKRMGDCWPLGIALPFGGAAKHRKLSLFYALHNRLVNEPHLGEYNQLR